VSPPGWRSASRRFSGGDGGELAQIAEARVRGIVPENTVAAAGDEEGNDDVGVALPEIEIEAAQVDDAELALAEAVERCAGSGVPLLTDVKSLFALDLGGRERAAAGRLGENWLTGEVEEGDAPRGKIEPDLKLRGEQRHGDWVFREFPRGRFPRRRDGHEAFPREERGIVGLHDAHDVGGAELHFQLRVVASDDHAVTEALHQPGARLRAVVGRAGGGREDEGEEAEKMFHVGRVTDMAPSCGSNHGGRRLREKN